MDSEWDDSQPIYRQLRDRVIAMILEGVLKEGDPLPSVRTVATDYRLNPLTVLKAYQQLVDEDLVEMKRGPRYVRQRRRRAISSKKRTPEIPGRGMAESSGTRFSGGVSTKELLTRRGRETLMAVIEARGIRKVSERTVALDGVDLRVDEGRIVGLIGPNGAGKTTALSAILGLIPYQGQLNVLGRDPWTDRAELMRDVAFIADIAVLPRWIRVSHLLDYVGGVHPRFDRAKAEGFLARTTIKRNSKVRELSKGMVAQLHLALVMAIDAKLLVLDEPTLGLDILYRKQFYDSLLNDYFDQNRTILVTTHQVEEIQDILTDVVFISRGRIVFGCSMEQFESRYSEVVVNQDRLAAARALRPIQERQLFGRSVLLFDSADRRELAGLGELRRPSIADLFVAVMEAEGATQ